MIKAKELKPTERTGVRLRGKDAEFITLSILQEMLLKKNEDTFGLPISIRDDKLESGGLFSGTVQDCLIITNTEHPSDYFKYCVTLNKQGKMATIIMQYYGQSELTGKANRAEERKRSGSLRGALANAVLGFDEAAYAAEYEYYDMLEQLFNEIFE
ncbi:MAG: hypothetical protein HPZ79_07360 [Oscillospiraceae bacterium]|nr:hypothetical protein [Oscillospiraceae bacterium]